MVRIKRNQKSEYFMTFQNIFLSIQVKVYLKSMNAYDKDGTCESLDPSKIKINVEEVIHENENMTDNGFTMIIDHDSQQISKKDGSQRSRYVRRKLTRKDTKSYSTRSKSKAIKEADVEDKITIPETVQSSKRNTTIESFGVSISEENFGESNSTEQATKTIQVSNKNNSNECALIETIAVIPFAVSEVENENKIANGSTIIKGDHWQQISKKDGFQRNVRRKLTTKDMKSYLTRSKSKSIKEADVEDKKTIPEKVQSSKRKSDCNFDDIATKKIKLTKNTTIETLEVNISEENSDEINSTEATKPNQIITDSNESASIKTVAVAPFALGEVIWGKIRGWPHWPAKVIAIERNRINVEWFNDYRTSKLYRSQIFKFYPNYDIFSEKFSSSVGLESAAKEALCYIASKLNIKLIKK